MSEAAYIHVCAATRACTLTSDIVGEKLRVDDLITRPLAFHEGGAPAPSPPHTNALKSDIIILYCSATPALGR